MTSVAPIGGGAGRLLLGVPMSIKVPRRLVLEPVVFHQEPAGTDLEIAAAPGVGFYNGLRSFFLNLLAPGTLEVHYGPNALSPVNQRILTATLDANGGLLIETTTPDWLEESWTDGVALYNGLALNVTCDVAFNAVFRPFRHG
jgi:hypothetical protein